MSSRNGLPPSVNADLWDEDDAREQQLYELIQPPIEHQLDVLIAQLCSVIARCAGNDKTPADYLPEWGKWLWDKLPPTLLTPDKPAAEITGQDVINAIHQRAAMNQCKLIPGNQQTPTHP